MTSEPAGARVRAGRLPPAATPFEGIVVVGDHHFELFRGGERELVDHPSATASRSSVAGPGSGGSRWVAHRDSE